MGLCASQARLLMLTARQSDLVLQAQQVSQARMTLANNQVAVTEKYNDAISNRKLSVKLDDEYVNLTPKALMDAGYGFKFNGVEYTSYDEEEIKEIFGSATEGVGEDDNVFQRYLMEGRIVLLEPKETGNGEEDAYMEISVSGTNDIKEEYDTEDDAAAKAEYDSAMAKLQTKDKALEMELDRINTQHNAITTEIESIESIVKKNIESSYKTFAES